VGRHAHGLHYEVSDWSGPRWIALPGAEGGSASDSALVPETEQGARANQRPGPRRESQTGDYRQPASVNKQSAPSISPRTAADPPRRPSPSSACSEA